MQQNCSSLSNGFMHLAGCRRCSQSVRSRVQGPVTHPQRGDWGVSCCCCCRSAGTHTFGFQTKVCAPHCCTMETWPFRKAFVAVALASADAIRQTACYWWSCRNAGCSCCYLRKRIFDFCCSPNWLSVNAPSFPRIHQIQPIPMLQMRMGG